MSLTCEATSSLTVCDRIEIYIAMIHCLDEFGVRQLKYGRRRKVGEILSGRTWNSFLKV